MIVSFGITNPFPFFMFALAQYTQSVVSGFSLLTVVGQVVALIVLVSLFAGPASVRKWISSNALWLMLVVAALAMSGSLFFSDIAGWTPCKLCWLQRITLYPQVAILIVALLRKDRSVAWTIALLSVIGIAIAAYHYGEQVYAALHPTESLEPCDASGTSCASTPFFHFGYITIPMMALTAMLLTLLGSIAILRSGEK